jgi:hypothetical protein
VDELPTAKGRSSNLASLTEQMRTAMVEAAQISAERGDAEERHDTSRH